MEFPNNRTLLRAAPRRHRETVGEIAPTANGGGQFRVEGAFTAIASADGLTAMAMQFPRSDHGVVNQSPE
jgi:hypothetical protein